MRTAVVTGATGFVGLNLVSELVKRDWRVIALHRPKSNLAYLQRFEVERRVAEVEDADSVMAAVPPSTDAIFHVAASVSWWRRAYEQQYQANVVGTRNVVRAALVRGVGRLVHTSSVAAYGALSGRLTEQTPSSAADSKVGYLRTKYLAEQEVRQGIAEGLAAVLLNPANIIGPFDLRNWGRSFRLVASGTLPGVPPGSGSFCHVKDVVDAHLAAVDRGRVGENYILAGVDATYLEMFQGIGRLLGKRVPRRPMRPLLVRLAASLFELGALFTGREPDITSDLAASMCSEWSASSEKAVRELGYATCSLEEMLRDCHHWLVAEGLI